MLLSEKVYWPILLGQIQGGQKCLSLVSSNFSKMVNDTKKKLSQLKENRLTNIFIQIMIILINITYYL